MPCSSSRGQRTTCRSHRFTPTTVRVPGSRLGGKHLYPWSLRTVPKPVFKIVSGMKLKSGP